MKSVFIKLKKGLLFAVIIAFGFNTFGVNPPDEGMWLPMFIKNYNYAEMQRLGLHLTPEQLYDINHSSLKDAIVQLGNGFCTGEIVSKDGLMFTNHHCGYSSVVALSSIEHDYLNNGFFAKNKSEELKVDFTVSFLERMEDVTATVLEKVTDSTSEAGREKIVGAAIKKLQKENSDDGRYRVVVKPFYEGNEYYMFIYTIYRDVRLVCAPPAAIGKFGGDTDNWMWPRHTGDFTVFRIYTAPDGSPAEYAEENIPLKPKHYLPVSIKGYENGDYAMVWGYPGTTERYMTSYEVKNAINITDPAIYEPLDIVLPVIKDAMNADEAVRLQYADGYAGLSNYWKNQHGEAISLQKLNVVGKKTQQEKELTDWINADRNRQQKYGTCLSEIQKICTSIDGTAYKAITNASLCLSASSTLLATWYLRSIELKDREKSYPADKIEQFLNAYDKQRNNKDIKTEVKIIMATLKTWEHFPDAYRPDINSFISKYYKGDYAKYESALYNSIFMSKEKLSRYLNHPSAKAFEKDPIVLYVKAISNVILRYQSVYTDMQKLDVPRRAFIAAMNEMKSSSPAYPDANSTMRVTYGNIKDYYPADGVHYNYFTTTQGILEKEKPGDPEFDVPAKLKNLILNKDFGQYADKDGTMHVCFLSNNDITGGNSGSPVINGDGELIGLAFDGNWESLSSDIAFNTELQRCINVDVRYVLFVIDKYGNAGYLLKEMDIRRDPNINPAPVEVPKRVVPGQLLKPEKDRMLKVLPDQKLKGLPDKKLKADPDKKLNVVPVQKSKIAPYRQEKAVPERETAR